MAKNKGALILGILGAIVSVITIIPGLLFLWRMIIKPKLFPSKPKKYNSGNSYAIITGAAGGIGKSFTERFAKEGYNIIAMDRMEEPLKQMKKDLEEKYKIKVEIMICDLIKSVKEDNWENVKEMIKDKDIAVLVNNVGMCNYLPAKYGDLEIREVNNMVSLNISTLCMMTHIVVQEMLKREKQSLIINMSSSTSNYPHPMLQVYSSTKAFVRQFTDSIYAEYKGKIDCIAYLPWYIKTEMTKIRENAIYALTPDAFVDCCFKFFGQRNHINPYWFHYFMDIGTSLLPEFFFSQNVIAQQSFVRKRLLIRREQEQKKQN